MDISKIAFKKYSPIQIQKLLKTFIELEENSHIIDGKYIRNPKQFTIEFIETELACTEEVANELFAELVDKKYIDSERLIPLPNGMALAQANDLPRISRKEATAIVETLISAAKKCNARPGARVFIESLDVFGSYISDKNDLGDIDVLAIIPMPEDCIPEDMDEIDAVIKDIRVSDYISFSDEFDTVAIEAKRINIFTRNK